MLPFNKAGQGSGKSVADEGEFADGLGHELDSHDKFQPLQAAGMVWWYSSRSF